MRRLLLVPVFMMVLSAGLHAGQVQSIDSLFYAGVESYVQGRYLESLSLLQSLDKVYPGHSRTTASLLMQAKALTQMERYQHSLEVYDRLILQYPGSEYVDDALYGKAVTYYYLDYIPQAVKQLLELVELGGDSRLLRRAAKLSVDLMEYRMTDADLRKLLSELTKEKSRAAVTIRLAENDIAKERFLSARQVLKQFIDQYPESPYTGQMNRLLSRAEKAGEGTMKIGVILPLSGNLEEQGRALLDGIEYAVDAYNNAQSARVGLVVRDSKSQVLTAVKAMQELASEKEIIAVIGGLESSITAAVAGVAQERGVPLLAPTATLDGLTDLGDWIFQLNSSLDVRARRLADYAVTGLGLKTFAIVAPADRDYGLSMRESFARRVHELEGEIVVEKWYFEGAETFQPQFKALREYGIQKMIKDSMIVQVREELWEDTLSTRKDTLFTKQSVTQLVDSTAMAVKGIDGIFLPVYAEDIPRIAPQLANYHFDSRLFGGTYWNDLSLLDSHKNYIDGIVFVADFYMDPSDYNVFSFRDAYRRARGKTPDKLEIFGYDAVNFILTSTGGRSMPRKDVRERLSGTGTVEGVGGRKILNDSRINQHLNMLQYRSGRIYQIR
ncbi:MAG TPA: outer membrane protein assembly factor BamD [bacterium]|nr:outer membrane protein assembly factor BamD [bacterium]